MNLKRYRMAAGYYKQNEFCKMIGISQSTYSRWETGSSYPTLDVLYQFAAMFKCKIKDLYDEPVIEKEGRRKKVEESEQDVKVEIIDESKAEAKDEEEAALDISSLIEEEQELVTVEGDKKNEQV